MSDTQFTIVNQGGGNRGQLERWSWMLGYAAEIDDTDDDLRTVILMRRTD